MMEGTPPNRRTPAISVVIPTYRREQVLLDTIDHVLRLQPAEILVVDQTTDHSAEVESGLRELADSGAIRWLRLSPPSIPRAMNLGLREARSDVVLFLDDDLLPDSRLIEEHARLHADGSMDLVAGHVIQPWDEPQAKVEGEPMPASDFMGGNFSVKRVRALDLGGFDENFLRVAYRYEADFAGRLSDAGGRIVRNPAAIVHHLKVEAGGTREYGLHYRTIRPDHAVGEYYYLLRGVGVRRRFRRLVSRPLRAVATRFHLRHPWWIPVTLLSEVCGLAWATALALRGPRYITQSVTHPPSS